MYKSLLSLTSLNLLTALFSNELLAVKDPRPNSDTKNHATDLHNLRTTCQYFNGDYGNKF